VLSSRTLPMFISADHARDLRRLRSTPNREGVAEGAYVRTHGVAPEMYPNYITLLLLLQ
jgi:hypothetical protein